MYRKQDIEDTDKNTAGPLLALKEQADLKKVGPVEGALEGLEKALSVLKEKVTTLGIKLSPALTPPSVEETKGEERTIYPCELAEVIARLTDRVEEIDEAIDDYINRLGL